MRNTDMQINNAGESRFSYKWWVMVVVSIGTIMSTLDASIVNISLPTIMHSLHATMASVQWVVTIYLLVITGLLLTLGRLADMIGRKHVFLAGYAVFTLGSLMCGFSHFINHLILFRAIQAIGAAMIMANGPAIITNVFPGSERGKALGVNAMVVAAGLTAGPALGGFLIALSGWQMIFFINVPIGILGMILVYRILAPDKGGSIQGFDFPGAVLLIMSLTSLTTALSDGVDLGWRSPIIIVLFCSFVICGIAFVMRERRTDTPLLNLQLFENRLFTFSSISALLAYIAMFCISYLMPFYLSQVLNYPPEVMGLVLITVPLTVALIAPFSGTLSDKIGSSGLGAVGMAVMGGGLILVSGPGSIAGTFYGCDVADCSRTRFSDIPVTEQQRHHGISPCRIFRNHRRDAGNNEEPGDGGRNYIIRRHIHEQASPVFRLLTFYYGRCNGFQRRIHRRCRSSINRDSNIRN